MPTPIFHVDAFTTHRFKGNPAAVMVMDRFADDAVLQEIAAENNLSETAFLVPEGGDYRLRWFTPATEVPLCGHATLASAAVFRAFQASRRGGEITCELVGERVTLEGGCVFYLEGAVEI